VQTAEGKLHLFVAIARASNLAFVKLLESATRVTASAFLGSLVVAYNSGGRLTRLRGLTPSDFIWRVRAAEPHRFTANPQGYARGLIA
jgi:hypothetical protein